MGDTTKNAGPTLNELIETCKDGEQGFQSAAQLVDDLNLRRLFESYAQQRAEFAAELQIEVRRLAADPVEGEQSAETLHRGWVGSKAEISGRDEGAIILECERSDDKVVRQYQEALEAGLPSHLHMIVERQFLEIRQAHDQVRSLERAHSRHS